jgi:hypothetical protein
MPVSVMRFGCNIQEKGKRVDESASLDGKGSGTAATQRTEGLVGSRDMSLRLYYISRVAIIHGKPF